MNFIAKHLNILGLLLLTAFVAAAAGMYFNVPTRLPKPQTVVTSNRYSCPMHPEVVVNQPGECSRCGMTLTSATGSESKHGTCQQGTDGSNTAAAAVSSRASCNHAEDGSADGCCQSKVQPVRYTLPSGCTRNLYPQQTGSTE